MAADIAKNYPQRHIFEQWFFSKKLEKLGYWYRQLLAESVGKIHVDGHSIGITPVVANGTVDLHSIAQLVLAHTSERSVTLITEKSHTSEITVPDSPFAPVLPNIVGKTFTTILSAAHYGFGLALQEK